MKKTLTLILAVLMLTAVFAGCGSKGSSAQSEGGVVNVYNWGENIDEELLKQFTEETGIKVNYNVYESNEQLYNVLKSGGTSYDVVIPSDYMISRMISEDMLEKINFDNVPNLSLIDESMRFMDYDKTGEYSVPYTWGTVGIIYNTTMVEEEVTSWGIMFDEKYKDNILMFDNSRDAMGIALCYLGYSQNTTDMTELQEAAALLEKQKPILQGYVMDQVYDKMENGEAAIGVYYAGDFLVMQQNNPDLRFCVPQEGSNKFVDCMVIPKGVENKENAEKFINFMCRTDVALQNAEWIGYTSPNVQVKEQIELSDEARAIMYPTKDVINRCEYYINLPQEVLDFYDAMWVKLKS